MSVYAIAQLWIHDPVTYGRYVDRFMEVFKNYKGHVLVADESLSYHEIAALTEQSSDAVRGKLHRARRAFVLEFQKNS